MTPPRISQSHLRVRYAETDAQGVVYYANYLVWFEVGRVDYLRQMGANYAGLEARGQGVMIAEAICRYHAPAHFDEELTICTWCDDIHRTSFRFRYEVKRGETLLAEGHTVQVFMDLAAGKPMRIPPEIRELLEPVGA
jgi:acyl-CoA thioester hydrolase